jgi:hypothetical protein
VKICRDLGPRTKLPTKLAAEPGKPSLRRPRRPAGGPPTRRPSAAPSRRHGEPNGAARVRTAARGPRRPISPPNPRRPARRTAPPARRGERAAQPRRPAPPPSPAAQPRRPAPPPSPAAQPDGPPEPAKSREAGKATRPANGTGRRCAQAGPRKAGKRGKGEDSGPRPSARYRGDQPGGDRRSQPQPPGAAISSGPANPSARRTATAQPAGGPRRPTGRPGLDAQPSAAPPPAGARPGAGGCGPRASLSENDKFRQKYRRKCLAVEVVLYR